MKKILILLSLFFLSLPLSHAKEIFTDEVTGNEYLFLGSLSPHENDLKLLDLKKGTVVWLDKNKLRHTDLLSPGEFLKKVFENGFVFYGEGDTPHWAAKISENKLLLLMPEAEGVESIPIKIDVDKHPIDNVFLMTFQSEDHQTYGVIRKLWFDTPCGISLTDESSVFEIFINSNGEVRKACARLDK